MDSPKQSPSAVEQSRTTLSTDADLLSTFVDQHDADALAELVSRHALLVHRVCGQLLSHAQDREDAFQATWLAVAMRAHTIRKSTAFVGWLHRVARRTALRLGQQTRRTQDIGHFEAVVSAGGSSAVPEGNGDPLQQMARTEMLSILHEELTQLPQRERAVIVLCDIEDYTRQHAAEVLGWTLPSVKALLQRARARLKRRLTTRGVSLPIVLVLACQWSRTAAAKAGAEIHRAVQCGWRWRNDGLTDVPSHLVSLAKEGSQSMNRSTWGKLLLFSGVSCALTASACIWLMQAARAEEQPEGVNAAFGTTTNARNAQTPAQPVAVVTQQASRAAGNSAHRQPASAPAGEAARRKIPLLGTWRRITGPLRAELNFTENELNGVVTLPLLGSGGAIKFRAEYSVASGNLVYAVIQSADVLMSPGQETDVEAIAELSVVSSMLLEQPFALRFYRDDSGLTIKDINLGILDAFAQMEGDSELYSAKALAIGRYESASALPNPATRSTSRLMPAGSPIPNATRLPDGSFPRNGPSHASTTEGYYPQPYRQPLPSPAYAPYPLPTQRFSQPVPATSLPPGNGGAVFNVASPLPLPNPVTPNRLPSPNSAQPTQSPRSLQTPSNVRAGNPAKTPAKAKPAKYQPKESASEAAAPESAGDEESAPASRPYRVHGGIQ